MAVTSHVWHLWPGRHWPALPEEEQQFVDDLQLLVDDHSDGVERMHYTAVLNALRCGLSAADLLGRVPGMHASDLLAAYVHLERLRMRSCHAWLEIIENPTVATLAEHSHDASMLLPVPLKRLATVASHVHAHETLLATVRTIAEKIAAHTRAATHVECVLAARATERGTERDSERGGERGGDPQTPRDAAAISLGTKLHHPQEPALWGAPYFLPERVTSLSPMRVADLLGERPAPTRRTR